WDSRWQEVAAGGFASWWFVDCSTAEHIELVIASHHARRAQSGPLALEDRGVPMLRATCAATAALKDGLAPAEALQRVDRAEAAAPAAAARREVHVLLRRFADPAREARAALSREPRPTDERYASYQHTLAEVRTLQVVREGYFSVR